MRVTCEHCGKALNLADDKAPSGSFQLTCPACKKRFVVPERAAADGGGVDRAGTDPPAPSDASTLPKLRPAEQELLSSLLPEAFVVQLGSSAPANLEKELERLGMEDVRRFGSLDDALEVLSDSGAGILVICMDKASAPPCEPLEPMERLSYAERRETFVVLLADNVKSLDGQVAFYLQVNCLINALDAGRFSVLVRRALLHHLRLYRFWTIEAAS